MSHTATIKVEFTDREVLKAVCRRLGMQFWEGQHTVRLYSSTEEADFSIQLPGWNYPIAIKGNSIKWDNYNGVWGKLTSTAEMLPYSKPKYGA